MPTFEVEDGGEEKSISDYAAKVDITKHTYVHDKYALLVVGKCACECVTNLSDIPEKEEVRRE